MMYLFKTIRIRSFEAGLLFRDGEITSILNEGKYRFFDPWNRIKIDVLSKREPLISHEKLDLLVRSGKLQDIATVFEFSQSQRGIVWVDGRLHKLLLSGRFAVWNDFAEVKVEQYDINDVQVKHNDLRAILALPESRSMIDVFDVKPDHEGALYIDGRQTSLLPSGRYGFWKGKREAKVVEVDRRNVLLDIASQEIMTVDKVTLRVNAVVTFKVVDSVKALSSTESYLQSLYRDAQLTLRSVLGAVELDAFLQSKERAAEEMSGLLIQRGQEYGLQVMSMGIRDVILPGEMKDLMNKVTEAKKAAEANLVSRREETAAMRCQVNTAKLLADNPTLMRLRELEVLENIASSGKLNVLLGDKQMGGLGLADKVTNLL